MSEVTAGICTYCKKEITKRTAAKHVQSCPARATAEGNERYFLISAQGRYLPEYWLYFEAKADMTLTKLDQYLRDIWLECCGHISTFTIDHQNYSSHPDTMFSDKSMRAKLNTVLHKGMSFRHEYDMGSTTELTLKVVGERLGAKRPATGVELLVRNVAPVIQCSECGKATAENVCVECVYDDSGWLCEDCSEDHACGEEMLLPVVNSPRMGVCGYTG